MTQATDDTTTVSAEPSVEELARPLRRIGWALAGLTVFSFAAGIGTTYLPHNNPEEDGTVSAVFNTRGQATVTAAHSVTATSCKPAHVAKRI